MVDKYALEIGFYPDGTMWLDYGMFGRYKTDPFTDGDKRDIIEQIVKNPALEYTADGKGNYYSFSFLSSLTTEGAGTIEGEIWLLILLHDMDIDTFKTIKEWRTGGQDNNISLD